MLYDSNKVTRENIKFRGLFWFIQIDDILFIIYFILISQ